MISFDTFTIRNSGERERERECGANVPQRCLLLILAEYQVKLGVPTNSYGSAPRGVWIKRPARSQLAGVGGVVLCYSGKLGQEQQLRATGK